MVTRERLLATRTIELTTLGRRCGRPRPIEIWWFYLDGRFVITGTPGPRDWLANVRHDSRVVIHVDGHDLAATATEIVDERVRRKVFDHGETRWYTTQAELERLVQESPMIEVHLPSGF